MSDNTDPQTLEVIQNVTTRNGGSRIKSNIMHFLIDYNVISNAIAFITAIEIRLLISETFETIGNHYFGMENRPLTKRLLVVIGICISCYLFIRYIYYPLLYTPNIAKENILKKAISKKEIDDTAEKIKKMKL